MLRRFGGQHPNIITLLATITCKVGAQRLDYHLLFPWAEGDLMHYWRSMPAPRSHMMAKWLSEQCYNIAEAIKYIHLAPGHKNDEGDDLFGRHGDVKPENVLWFKRGGKNVLVLSDLGISAIHREGSRSRQEPQHVEMTPTYQSPERDMDGFQRYISRSFDVWSLGCVFLDFIIWSLGGNSERLDFLQQRFSLWLGNVKFNLYYDVAPVKNKPGSFAFRIKECVTEVRSRYPSSVLHKCLHRKLTHPPEIRGPSSPPGLFAVHARLPRLGAEAYAHRRVQSTIGQENPRGRAPSGDEEDARSLPRRGGILSRAMSA